MILYFENSHGIGNTIIELSVICTLYPHKKIIFFSCSKENLPISKSNIKLIKYKRTFLNRILIKIIKYLFLTLSKVKIFSLIYEELKINKKKIILRKGLINHIILVAYSNHFQIPEYLDNSKLILNKVLCDDVIQRELQNKNYIKVNWDNACFIHVRRGDYLFWPSDTNPAILNLSWYKKAIERIKKKHKINKFIVFTNDFFYVKDTFGDDKDIIIFHENPIVDLLVMSKCRHGILSASSFSWLAAKISRNRYKNQQFFLAPKYWAGHRSKVWYPHEFKFDWINYF